MRLLADWALVDPEPWTTQKQGTIVLPDNATIRKVFARGQVCEAGPGKFTANGVQLGPPYGTGDHVFYYKDQAVPIIVGGKEMHLIREGCILGILESGDMPDDSDTNKQGVTTE